MPSAVRTSIATLSVATASTTPSFASQKVANHLSQRNLAFSTKARSSPEPAFPTVARILSSTPMYDSYPN